MPKRLIIIHENNEWLEPIKAALKEEDVDFEEWFLGTGGSIDLSIAPPDAIYFNRMSPSAHTRGHPYASNFALTVLAWLQRHGRYVINDFHVWQMEINKVLQYNALTERSIDVPHTLAAFSKPDIVKAASKVKLPLILKHNCGGKGTGVIRFNSLEELDKYVQGADFQESPDGITLVQEYIESKEPYILRLEFIDKKFIYALRIDTSGGFELCPADACALEESFCPTTHNHSNKFSIVPDFKHPIIAKYHQFLQEEDIDVAGIECVFDKNDNVYTYDINTNTNYSQAAEQHAGITSAYAALAQYLSNLI